MAVQGASLHTSSRSCLSTSSPGDLQEFTNPEYMAQVARLNVAVLGRLASAPPPPGELRIRAVGPGGHSGLPAVGWRR